MDKQLKTGDWCYTPECGRAQVLAIRYCDRVNALVADVVYSDRRLTTGYADGMGERGRGVEFLADLEACAPW